MLTVIDHIIKVLPKHHNCACAVVRSVVECLKFLHIRSGHYPFAEVNSESVLCLRIASETVEAGWSFQLESFVCGCRVLYFVLDRSQVSVKYCKREPTDE